MSSHPTPLVKLQAICPDFEGTSVELINFLVPHVHKSVFNKEDGCHKLLNINQEDAASLHRATQRNSFYLFTVFK
ncbi:hypothetical protein EXN66_Car000040 [Channa argus]|uniref:Uncharacterized protein n=1 Tax=Channa argus TaxID=215402 RepID=A0A6G1QX18_CHAAH|nr:hypothetical protein EXN66_Car000040 [Channa argus]